jgi:hypothetical protein
MLGALVVDRKKCCKVSLSEKIDASFNSHGTLEGKNVCCEESSKDLGGVTIEETMKSSTNTKWVDVFVSN